MSHTISAEMVANVHSIAVEIGQRVEPTTELVLLESMKMEIPVLAEVAGVVTEIAVAAGDSIQEGDVIAIIEERT